MREDIMRPQILDTIRERLLALEGVAYVRKRSAEDLRDQSKKIDAELRERKERLKRTEEKMAGLADFIAGGERSQYIVTTLRDHETFAKQEREAIEHLEDQARMPIRLPSLEEVEAQVIQFDDRLMQDRNRPASSSAAGFAAVRSSSAHARTERSSPTARSCR